MQYEILLELATSIGEEMINLTAGNDRVIENYKLPHLHLPRTNNSSLTLVPLHIEASPYHNGLCPLVAQDMAETEDYRQPAKRQ